MSALTSGSLSWILVVNKQIEFSGDYSIHMGVPAAFSYEDQDAILVSSVLTTIISLGSYSGYIHSYTFVNSSTSKSFAS